MSCYHSIIIDASPEEVWSAISNFHDMNWAPEVISSLTIVGEASGSEIGAGRILNGLFHETLKRIDHERHEFSYSIDDGPDVISKEVVSNYVGTVRLRPITDDGRTFVEWSSEYESADPDAVADFCNPIYHALLASMKGHFAGKP